MKKIQKTREQLISELQQAQSELQEARGRIDLLTRAAEKLQQPTAPATPSADKFYKAFQSSPDMIIITSIPGGVYIEVNDAFANKVGYRLEELIGHKMDEFNFFVSSAEADKMMALLQKDGKFKNEEFSFRVRSGELQRWLCSAEPVNFNGETCLVSVATDITKRRRMEQELNETQQMLQIASNLTPQSICIASLEQTRFIEVNDVFCRLSGFSRDELLNTPTVNMKLWDNVEIRDHIIERLKAGERVSNEKVIFLDRRGGKHKALFSAQPITIRGEDSMICSSTDITSLEEMEKALEISEEKFSRAFSSSPAAMCIFSIDDSKFTEINDSYSRFTGYTREEIIGHTVDELNLWVNQDEKDHMSKSLQETGSLLNERIYSRMKSGKVRTGLFSAQDFDIAGKKHMILTINDITDQVKAMDAIANEAALRRVLIHNSRDGIVILESDGKVYESNKRFADMLGYTLEEMSQLYVWNWEYLSSREKIQEMIDNVGVNGDHFETQHRRKDGTIYDVEISSNGATVAGKKLVFCVCRDITQRKMMELALIDSEAKFSKAFQSLPVSVSISRLSDGVFINVNDYFCRSVGLPREEIIGRTAGGIGVWTGSGGQESVLKAMKIQTHLENIEYEYKQKNGGTRTVLLSADVLNISGVPHMLVIGNDITERKRMERTLQESEEKFSKAFLASPQIIAITSVKDGTYIEVNDNYVNTIGFTREELIGRTSKSLNIWVENSQRDDMIRTLEREGRIVEKEYGFRTKDGRIRSWLFSGEPIIIKGEKCLMGVCVDITERKVMEAKALEAENLREVNRLRGEFLANVSHELRTPLAGIKGFTTMLIDYDKRLKSGEKREYLETIDKNADTLAALIEQLLEMSRLGAGMLSIKKKPTDVAALCKDVIRESRAQAPGHIFTLESPKKLPLIDLDSQRIHQVLNNLLDNAVKYSNSGTEVKLTIRVKDPDLLFTITDQGRGISQKDSVHIFDRLFSSRNVLSGTRGAGLSLAICKGLIEAHNGTIWFESKEGVGTSFFFSLPLKSPKDGGVKKPAEKP